jgi:hypothetical protein
MEARLRGNGGGMTVWIRGATLGDFRVRVGIAAVIVCSTRYCRSLIRRNGPERACARYLIVFAAPMYFLAWAALQENQAPSPERASG